MNVLKIWFLIISRWIKRAVKLKIKRAAKPSEKEKNQQPKKEIKAKVITEVETPLKQLQSVNLRLRWVRHRQKLLKTYDA